MEFAGYRETIELLSEVFPNRGAISVAECADFLGLNIKTVYASIVRRNNPMPSINVSTRKRMIPVISLAYWLCKKE